MQTYSCIIKFDELSQSSTMIRCLSIFYLFILKMIRCPDSNEITYHNGAYGDDKSRNG